MEDDTFMFVLGILFGIAIGLVIFITFHQMGLIDEGKILLSNSTANELCYNFTSNSAAQGSAKDGKLICSIPSFDHSQNIIIKSNSLEDNGQ